MLEMNADLRRQLAAERRQELGADYGRAVERDGEPRMAWRERVARLARRRGYVVLEGEPALRS